MSSAKKVEEVVSLDESGEALLDDVEERVERRELCEVGDWGLPGLARAFRLPVGLDHGRAAKTWAAAPPLKAVVLMDSMVSGAVKIRSPAPRTTG